MYMYTALPSLFSCVLKNLSLTLSISSSSYKIKPKWVKMNYKATANIRMTVSPPFHHLSDCSN